MSKPVVFTSIFAPYFHNYLQEKEARGYKAIQIKWILLEFDRFFLQSGQNSHNISFDSVKKWAETRVNDGDGTLYQKFSVLAGFCRYMCLLGHDCYIPRLPRKKRNDNFIPFIFTHEQMCDIFNACDRLVMKEHHANSILFIIPALIRVLYSTGIRISEALSILNRDIDFERHVILLNKTKNRCQRLAPINESLEQVLKQYINYRNRIPVPDVANPDRHLFISTIGKACSRSTVLMYFHRILELCGIPRCNDQRGPRLHDVRHTTGVHSLIKSTREGEDFYSFLPLLATFMGHKKVLDTENYLRMTQEAYPEILKMNAEVSLEIYSNITSKLIIDYENRND
jgi:integrase